MTTVPLLEVCLPPEKLVIRRGRRFYENNWPDLHKLLNKPTTLLLYPGPTGLSIVISLNFTVTLNLNKINNYMDMYNAAKYIVHLTSFSSDSTDQP